MHLCTTWHKCIQVKTHQTDGCWWVWTRFIYVFKYNLSEWLNFVNLIYKTGYPVAWYISNQETTKVVTLLFQSIKQQSPDIQIQVLTTDDGKQHGKYMTLYLSNLQVIVTSASHMCTPVSLVHPNLSDEVWSNAGKRVLGKGIQHLWCHWHVDR